MYYLNRFFLGLIFALGSSYIQSSHGQQDGPAGREPLAEPHCRGRVSPPLGGGTPCPDSARPGSTGHEGTLGGPRVDLSPCADCNVKKVAFAVLTSKIPR